MNGKCPGKKFLSVFQADQLPSRPHLGVIYPARLVSLEQLKNTNIFFSEQARSQENGFCASTQ